MKRETKIVLVVLIIAVVLIGIYLATRPSSAAQTSFLGGGTTTPGTTVAGVGTALTQLGTTIADAASGTPT